MRKFFWNHVLLLGWPAKLFALGGAVILWFYVHLLQFSVITINAKVRYINLPSDMVLARRPPRFVDMRLRSSKTVSLESMPMDVEVDLASASIGEKKYEVMFDDDVLPDYIQLSEPLKPIKIFVDQKQEKQVPVRVNFRQDLVKEYNIQNLLITPKNVTIQGPKSILKKITSVSTNRVDVDKGYVGSFKTKVPLKKIKSYGVSVHPKDIVVNFLLEKNKEYEVQYWNISRLYYKGLSEELSLEEFMGDIRVKLVGERSFFQEFSSKDLKFGFILDKYFWDFNEKKIVPSDFIKLSQIQLIDFFEQEKIKKFEIIAPVNVSLKLKFSLAKDLE